MTNKLKLKDIKDKLKDDTLDLSLCELKEVPVREIASLRKVTNLNLSTNLLISLPTTFINLKQIVKLDLSRNMLDELPENFGEMTKLKHLDLYANKISRLPLSLSELKNLRWLDLKENPLTPAVATVAGPCSNIQECQACARNIVTYLSNVKLEIEKERLRRLSNVIDDTEKEMTTVKKESKKKKKKNTEKGDKTNGKKIDCQTKNKNHDNNDSARLTKLLSDNMCTRKAHKSTGAEFNRSLICMIVWFSIISSLLTVALVFLSWHYKQQMDTFLQNAQTLLGLPLKNYHKHTIDSLQHVMKIITVQLKSVVEIVNDLYEAQFKNNNGKKEL